MPVAGTLLLSNFESNYANLKKTTPEYLAGFSQYEHISPEFYIIST